ncbi:uncharacterized protein LOC117122237 [Anneissia japonica]|uniref:uncharacterized protein LOC117122237 n=1 Tax=Anneissia japonica TaxID=1529436 RepID=UPI0014258FC6|nr:uncharacterized protein LOC117122237 [Anneissia japonica]
MYQPNFNGRWLKDGWKLNQSQRISIDENNNVEIIELQHDDRGKYECELEHENERVIVNTVYLHFGSTGHTMGESGSWLNKQNEALGLDNILVVSLMISIATLCLWGTALAGMRYKARSGDDDSEAA